MLSIALASSVLILVMPTWRGQQSSCDEVLWYMRKLTAFQFPIGWLPAGTSLPTNCVNGQTRVAAHSLKAQSGPPQTSGVTITYHDRPNTVLSMNHNQENYQARLDFVRGLLRNRLKLGASGFGFFFPPLNKKPRY